MMLIMELDELGAISGKLGNRGDHFFDAMCYKSRNNIKKV